MTMAVAIFFVVLYNVLLSAIAIFAMYALLMSLINDKDSDH
jgi:hypothetical protein